MTRPERSAAMDAESGADRSAWFGPALFGAEARDLARVGVIDMGSNSVRLVVFDGAARSPAYFYNEKVMAGLGAGAAETGRLNPEGKIRALSAMRRFRALAEGMEVRPLVAVATAAVREAEDGPDFRAEVEAVAGVPLHVIDGADEARLSAQGVMLGWPEAEGLVCDIGGSSMELAELTGGAVGDCATSELGPLKLQNLGGAGAIDRTIEKRIGRLRKRFAGDYPRLYLVGGSWRAIARIDTERRDYPLKVLHEYRMTPGDVSRTLDLIARSDPEDLRARTGTGAERMRLVPLAARVLGALVDAIRPDEIAVSSYGIREGLLYEQMPAALRQADPLIAAAQHAEITSARMPGFGTALMAFIRPLFPDPTPARARLIRAACHLHDVTWRAHPDYRAEVCFDNATRANLGGLTHPERVFLGLALLHRYKSSRKGTRFDPLLSLLSEDEVREAEVLGRALRFGAMFAVAEPGAHGALALSPGTLTLTLKTDQGRALFGEVARARLEALAGAMDREAVVEGPG